MPQKILLTLDESENSMKAVDYVRKIAQPDDTITLFSVIPNPTAACVIEDPSLVPIFNESRATFCAIEEMKRENIQKFMEKAKDLLATSQINPAHITIKIVNQRENIARDILSEVQQGTYDNIVMGRRGLSGIKEFLLGSVSHKVIQFARNTAVTVVE